MKRFMMVLLLITGLGGIAGPEVGHVSANETVSQTSASSVGTSADPGVVTDGRAGGYAAIGCGIFGRALGSGMHHPLVWAGAVATCFYMIVDAIWL